MFFSIRPPFKVKRKVLVGLLLVACFPLGVLALMMFRPEPSVGAVLDRGVDREVVLGWRNDPDKIAELRKLAVSDDGGDQVVGTVDSTLTVTNFKAIQALMSLGREADFDYLVRWASEQPAPMNTLILSQQGLSIYSDPDRILTYAQRVWDEADLSEQEVIYSWVKGTAVGTKLNDDLHAKWVEESLNRFKADVSVEGSLYDPALVALFWNKPATGSPVEWIGSQDETRRRFGALYLKGWATLNPSSDQVRQVAEGHLGSGDGMVAGICRDVLQEAEESQNMPMVTATAPATAVY